MSSVVVDASVAGKWFFAEQHSDRSSRLLSSRRTLLAPDLLMTEFGNLIWKRCRRSELSQDEARAVLRDFLRIPLSIVPSSPLVGPALEIALACDRTFYDCLYLALAVNRNCRLVTADERFVNALASGPYSRYIRWIGK